MKLSICMMVKNEENNLERCLKSLEFLRNSVKSELIIIDTGSTDKTIEIASKYTNLIYFHEWNNNFSEMRNISISYAKGDWVFIIDADEELIDGTNIVDFLNKKHGEHVTGAALYLRNIINVETRQYSAELVTPRIFKSGIGFKYEGSVHNRPVVNGEIIFLESILHHYGYIVDDKELMEKKFIRTRTLLLKELSEDPSNIYFLYQLATTYGMHRDHREAYAESLKGYMLASKSKKLLKDNLFIVGLYATDCLANDKFNEAIEACKSGIEVESDYLDLYFYLATAYCRSENYKESIKYYIEYLERLKTFGQSKFLLTSSIQHYTLHKSDEALSNIAISYFFLSDYEMGYKYSLLALGEINKTSIYFQSVYKVFCVTSLKLRRFQEIANSFSDNENYDENILISSIEEGLCELKKDEILSLYKILSQVEHMYCKILKLRYLKEVESNLVLSNIPSNWKYIDFSNANLYEKELIYFLMFSKETVSSLFTSLHESTLMEIINYLDEKYEDFLSVLVDYNAQMKVSNLLSIDEERLLNKVIMFKSLNLENESDSINNYIESAIAFIRYKYTEEYIKQSNRISGATSEECFLINLIKILYYSSSSDMVKKLSDLLEDYSEYHFIVRFVINNQIQKIGLLECRNSNNNNIEMDDLKNKLKENINLFIETDKIEDASMLINEYLKLFPNDLDMIFLKSELLVREMDKQ